MWGGCRQSWPNRQCPLQLSFPTSNNRPPKPYSDPVTPRGVRWLVVRFTALPALSDPLKDLWWVSLCCCSIARSCPTLPPHGLLHATLSCPSLSSGACSCPLSPGCHLSSSSSAALFSFSPHSLPASGSIPTSWLLESGDQSTRV